MRKLGVLVLILLMFFSKDTNVIAKNKVNLNQYENIKLITIIGDNVKQDLTLGNIVKMIEEDNLEVKMLDEKVKLYNRLYDRDLNIAQSLDNERDSGINYYNTEFRKQQMLYYKQTALQLHDVEHERHEKLKEIKRGLKEQYLNLVNAKKDIKNIKDSIINLDKQMEKIKANIEQGKVSKNALESLKVQKAQLEASLNVISIQEKEGILKIKQYLGIDLDKDLDVNPLCSKLSFEKYDDSNIVNVISKAVDDNYELGRKNKELEYAEVESYIYEKYGRNTLSEKTNTELRIRDIKNSIMDYKLNLNINLWKAYYTLKNKEDVVNVEKTKLEEKTMRHNEAKYRYDAGLIDKVQLDSSKLEYERQNIQYEKSINDYMICVESFNNLLGTVNNNL